MPWHAVQRSSDRFYLLGSQLHVASFVENHGDWQVGHRIVVVIANIQIPAVLPTYFPNLFALNLLVCIIKLLNQAIEILVLKPRRKTLGTLLSIAL